MVVAAPCYTRPESEQWFCSLRLGVLEGDVKSRSLKRAFGWDRPLPGLVLAVQLVSLSMKFEVCVCFLLLLLVLLACLSMVSLRPSVQLSTPPPPPTNDVCRSTPPLLSRQKLALSHKAEMKRKLAMVTPEIYNGLDLLVDTPEFSQVRYGYTYIRVVLLESGVGRVPEPTRKELE